MPEVTREAPRSERWLHRIPYPLVEHPFAVVMCMWGLIVAPPMLAGVTRPGSLAVLLPRPLVVCWSALMLLAAVSIGWGLITRRYSTRTAAGLQLMGTVCLAWAVSVTSVAPLADTIPATSLLAVLAVLCYLRGWFLRAQAAMLRRTLRHAHQVEQEMNRRDEP